MKKYIFILSCAYILLAIMGCTDRSADAVQRRLDDTLYTEENILMTYDRQPERALGMIDTAVIVGTLSDFRADLLRAKVYCSGIEAANYDSAIVIGERLMQHDSIMAHQNLQEEVLDILMSASRLCHDDDQALYWGMKLSELYRQRDETTEALRTDAELGKLAVQLGQQREGLALIDSVVRQLEGQRHFNELDATIIALKRKAEVCYEKGLRADMIPAARRMLELLSDYEQQPDVYHDNSVREPPEEMRPGYIDFYRAKAYGYLAMAYEPRREALEYISLFDKTDYGQTVDGRYFIALTAGRMGQYDRMLAAYDDYEPAFISDTLSPVYAELLYNRAEAANAQGRYADAYELMERYAALNEQIHENLLQGKAHLYATRFHVQQQQEEIEHQKSGRRYVTMVAFFVGLLALMGLFFAWYAARQWRKTKLKNRVLVKQMKEAIIYKEKYEESEKLRAASLSPPTVPASLDGMSPEELFRYIEKEVRSRLLFLNPSFDRQMIMDEFHLSKERVGAAFSQGSKYDSLPQFVSDLRLEYASKLLITTDLPINEITAKAGFSNASVFSRYFSRKFQISPSQYRQANSADSEQN